MINHPCTPGRAVCVGCDCHCHTAIVGLRGNLTLIRLRAEAALDGRASIDPDTGSTQRHEDALRAIAAMCGGDA